MGKSILFFLILAFVLAGPFCYSQTSVEVSDPRLEMIGNKICISYDILNSVAEEIYEISIEIKDEAGNIIDAEALIGDIGEYVVGGNNKQIIWDLEADNVVIDSFILVKVKAWALSPLAPTITEPEEEIVIEDATTEKPVKEETPSLNSSNKYNRTGIALQSIAFPGLGLSRVTGKPHWIRGVIGYGCIAGSVVLNRQAIKIHNTIYDLEYFDDVIEANEKSAQQDNISEILSYAALGIWVTDLIWTIVGTSDLNKPTYSADVSGFSFRSDIDPFSNTPMISVRYRF